LGASLGTLHRRGETRASRYHLLQRQHVLHAWPGRCNPDERVGAARRRSGSRHRLGFLAIVISYIPVLCQAFSRREVAINQLDARAGSPPTGLELLRRHGPDRTAALERLLADWERWAAELIESHLSYPLLGYYRSQHDNQSWLAALTTVLDACALLLCVVDDAPEFTARLTFAIARDAAVDLSQAFRRGPATLPNRMTPEVLTEIRGILLGAGFVLRPEDEASTALGEMRLLYEPYIGSLSPYLLTPLPS